MFQIKALDQAVNAGPVTVTDQWGQGWSFQCVDASARVFRAVLDPAMEAAAAAHARLLAGYPPRVIQEVEVVGRRLARLREETDIEEKAFDALDGISDEARDMYVEQMTARPESQRLQAAAAAPSVDHVAPLVSSWSGVKDEGGAVLAFSDENLRGLLSEPNRLQGGGDSAGDTIGEAVRRRIVAEIRRISAERNAEVESNEKNSSGERSSGAGSTTVRRTKKRERSGTRPKPK